MGSSDLLALIQNGDELRIRLHGELNLDNHSSLRSLLEEVLKKTNQHLVLLDLSAVQSISSSAFGALVDFTRRLQLIERTLILLHPSPDCRHVMDLLNLRPFFNVQEN